MNDQIFDKSYWLNSRHISFHKMNENEKTELSKGVE